jgi:hypothetical protein
MRGRSSVWYRIRINLQHVPGAERPAQERLEADYDPWAGSSPRALIQVESGLVLVRRLRFTGELGSRERL